MNYSEILKTYIHESGLSLSQVADQLKDKGFSTDKGYISKLQNGKISPAGEDLNRALADITGGDSDKLTWYAYIEKAPEKYKSVLYQLGEEVIPYARELTDEYPGFFQGEYSNEKMKEIEKTEVGKNFIRAFMDSITKDVPDVITEPKQDYGMALESEDTPLYKRHLNLAKQSLELYYKSNSGDNNFIDSALLIAFMALELRVNEVLLKAMKIKGIDEERGLELLDEFSLKGKFRTPMFMYLDVDITQQKFFQGLLATTKVINEIKHRHQLTKPLSSEDAQMYLEVIKEIINFIDEKAKEKGIE